MYSGLYEPCVKVPLVSGLQMKKCGVRGERHLPRKTPRGLHGPKLTATCAAFGPPALAAGTRDMVIRELPALSFCRWAETCPVQSGLHEL